MQAQKADIESVNEALAQKANIADVNRALEHKADSKIADEQKYDFSLFILLFYLYSSLLFYDCFLIFSQRNEISTLRNQVSEQHTQLTANAQVESIYKVQEEMKKELLLKASVKDVIALLDMKPSIFL